MLFFPAVILVSLFGSGVQGNFTMESLVMQEHYSEQMIEKDILLKEELTETDTAYTGHEPKHQVLPRNFKRTETYPQQIPNSIASEVTQFTFGSTDTLVGAGYSSDSQQVAPQKCYRATVSSTSDQQSDINLDTGISYSELESKLDVSVSVGGTYDIFSANAKASYLRTVQDTDYSISTHFYVMAGNNVQIQLAGHGEEALTDSGKGFYNNGANPYFGVICGEQYISSYRQGALLTMGLNIKFSSSDAKTTFEEEVDASFTGIVNAAESVRTLAKTLNIDGSITIHAFQMGGEPSRLSHMFTRDSIGEHSALACSLTAMDNCIKAVGGLLDYAKNDFSEQFSFQTNIGLTPLGPIMKTYPVDYIGLTLPASLVTPEVLQHRNELSDKLKENEYYIKKLTPFFRKRYPVELDKTFLKKAKRILSKANRNVAKIMQAHDGAAGCFYSPDKCKNISAHIYSRLQNITVNDLTFLEAIKYTVTTKGGMFYNTGSKAKWHAAPIQGEDTLVMVKSYTVTIVTEGRGEYIYSSEIQTKSSPPTYIANYIGHTNGSTTDFLGNFCSQPKPKGYNWEVIAYKDSDCGDELAKERLIISPFFFEAFDISEVED